MRFSSNLMLKSFCFIVQCVFYVLGNGVDKETHVKHVVCHLFS